MRYISNILHIEKYLSIMLYLKCLQSYVPSMLTKTFDVILPFTSIVNIIRWTCFYAFTHRQITFYLSLLYRQLSITLHAITTINTRTRRIWPDFFVLEHKLVVHKSINSWCCAMHVHTLAFKCNKIVEFLEYHRITLYK